MKAEIFYNGLPVKIITPDKVLRTKLSEAHMLAEIHIYDLPIDLQIQAADQAFPLEAGGFTDRITVNAACLQFVFYATRQDDGLRLAVHGAKKMNLDMAIHLKDRFPTLYPRDMFFFVLENLRLFLLSDNVINPYHVEGEGYEHTLQSWRDYNRGI